MGFIAGGLAALFEGLTAAAPEALAAGAEGLGAAGAAEAGAAGAESAAGLIGSLDAAGNVVFAAPTAAEAASLAGPAAFGGEITAASAGTGLGVTEGLGAAGLGAGAGALLAGQGGGAAAPGLSTPPVSGGPGGLPAGTEGGAVPGTAPATPSGPATNAASSSGAVASPLAALNFGDTSAQLLAGGSATPEPATPAVSGGDFAPISEAVPGGAGTGGIDLASGTGLEEESALPPGAQPTAYSPPGATAESALSANQASPLDTAQYPAGPVDAPPIPPADVGVTPPAAPAAAAENSPSLFSQLTKTITNSPLSIAAGLAPLALTLARGESKVPSQFGTLTDTGNQLNAIGEQNLQLAANNQLTAPQAASIATTREGLVNQLRQQVYSSGQDPNTSTTFQQGMQQIDQQIEAMTQTMINNTLTAGLQETGQASQDLIAAGNAQVAQDTAFSSAIGSAAQALGTVVGLSAIAGSAGKTTTTTTTAKA